MRVTLDQILTAIASTDLFFNAYVGIYNDGIVVEWPGTADQAGQKLTIHLKLEDNF